MADGLGGLGPEAMPEDMGGPKSYRPAQPILVADKARHVGDRVAFVVAETLAQAKDAAELIEIDYEVLPAVAALGEALNDGAPKVWDDAPSNLCFPADVRRRGEGRRCVRQGGERPQAFGAQQPRLGQRDGAARRAGRL